MPGETCFVAKFSANGNHRVSASASFPRCMFPFVRVRSGDARSLASRSEYDQRAFLSISSEPTGTRLPLRKRVRTSAVPEPTSTPLPLPQPSPLPYQADTCCAHGSGGGGPMSLPTDADTLA